MVLTVSGLGSVWAAMAFGMYAYMGPLTDDQIESNAIPGVEPLSCSYYQKLSNSN